MALVETHKILSIIREHGVDEKTANAIVDAVSYSREGLTTKQDLEILEGKLKQHAWMVAATMAGVQSVLTIGIISVVIVLFV